jgi:hypothetical protein
MLGAFLVVVAEALFAFAGGAKECGGAGWGLYSVSLLPAMWIYVPWTALGIPVGFLLCGIACKFEHYRTWLWVISAVLGMAALLIGVTTAPQAPTPCRPI